MKLYVLILFPAAAVAAFPQFFILSGFLGSAAEAKAGCSKQTKGLEEATSRSLSFQYITGYLAHADSRVSQEEEERERFVAYEKG